MAKVSFGSGGGGGASTGVPIGGAVANTVLFSDASSNLGSVAGFNFLQTMNQSSGTSSVFEVARSITQSSTAAYNGIRVNITETSTGSGIKNLLSLQIGGANRARIDNTGSTFLSNTATSGFRVFNSADETTNTEFAGVRWDTNVAKFGADRTGSGTERESWFGSMFGGLGRTYIRCIPSGVVHMYLDVPGSSTAGQTGFWLSNNAAYNASSGSQSFMYMTYSVSQSGSAGYTTLLVNTNETSTGSGTKRLIYATVGNAFRFAVRNDGQFEIRTANTSATVGAAGGASALPATPLGYISAVTEAGTNIKIPYYNA